MTTTLPETGPLIKHTAVLSERHLVVVELPGRRHDVLPSEFPEIVSACERRARAWADAHGLELGGLGVYSSASCEGKPARVGVSFEVVVGKGEIDADQSPAGHLDRWRWSGGRLDWWRNVFNRSDQREGRKLVAREEGDNIVAFPRLASVDWASAAPVGAGGSGASGHTGQKSSQVSYHAVVDDRNIGELDRPEDGAQ